MAGINCSDILSPTFARMFNERLKRIVEESYEVAFILCNKEMEEFSSSKVFDIFTQVFTTAYVLNTGYWPFFSTVNGQCLCICGRFGIPCRHIRNGSHWIDMQPIEPDSNAIIFYPRLYGPLIIQDYEVIVKSLEGASGYYINIILNVQYKRTRPRREKGPRGIQKDIGNKSYPISIFSRFYLMGQFYSAFFTIVFQPNPFFNQYYGTLFKKLINLRAQEFCFFREQERQLWCIAYNQMPSSTFVHHHVNVPVYKFPTQLLVFNHLPPKNKIPPTKNKTVQTHDIPVITNQNTWNNFGLEETPSISETLKSFASKTVAFMNSEASEYIIIDDSEEFDNQWPSVGYNKIIQQPNQLMIEYNSCDFVENVPQDLSRKKQNLVWTIKTEPDSTTSTDYFLNSEEEFPLLVSAEPPNTRLNMNFSRAVTNEKHGNKDENWFEKNFPPIKTELMRKMEKSEVDEEFEIIQNVIRDDVLKQEGNLDWWNNNIKQ